MDPMATFPRTTATVPGAPAGATATAEPDAVVFEDTTAEADPPWLTIVWNDPVNLMSYVTYVFQKVFGYSKQKATRLMLDVHQKGRAVVSRGSHDEMEADVAKLHAYGLWATVSRDS
ncbi:ATP-dependent Clp protease adapter ClpS [Fodinicola acaciae]|uniref:ATP-dependent Clp protease adapter ClpS n=1 Tax=Fodinicola acaciae TaxID=2681555 RepID=UPI0013D56BF0|nr:ATP-dependent Clp protease adapter ClpS [Fodinicola acaciae]